MVFYHPKYYKELRKLRNNLDQAISTDRSRDKSSVTPIERAPGPGPKRQASEDSTANSTRGRVAEPGASSNKLKEPQASSDKHQASSSKLVKPQATSFKPRG